MKITLYFINWNDSFYLPFIKEHYGKFCQRIVMYDNHSTDGSQELAKSLGFEVVTFGYANRLDDQDYLNVKNHCWKECRTPELHADYVIVCDADEFLCRDENFEIKGSAPTVRGFNMISESLPEKSILEINTGEYSENYSKQVIFDPNRIEEISFVHGCHRNNIIGDITKEVDLNLFHYRQIGGVQRMIDRHSEYKKRMSAFNRKHGMGIHYLHEDEQKKIEWEMLKSTAKELW